MNHKKFVELVDAAKSIANNNSIEWSTKYELIFSDGLLNKIFITGVDFEWVDPDTTYEEDVTAFVDAVSKKADELRELNTENSLLVACIAAREWLGDRPDEKDDSKWGPYYESKRALIDQLDRAIGEVNE